MSTFFGLPGWHGLGWNVSRTGHAYQTSDPDVSGWLFTSAVTVRRTTECSAVAQRAQVTTTRNRAEVLTVATYVKRVDDTLPIFSATLLLDGVVFDLNDPDNGVESATLRYRLRGASSWTERSLTIHPTTTGLVTYEWQSSEPATAGVYEFVARVTFTTGDVQSFPNGDGYASFQITAGSS